MNENDGGPYTLGLDIGGTGLKGSVLDKNGHMVVDRVRVPTPKACRPDRMVEVLTKLVKPLPAFDRISIGFPGVVRNGKVVTAPHFGNDIWRGFPLQRKLGERLGKPARLSNDAEILGQNGARRKTKAHFNRAWQRSNSMEQNRKLDKRKHHQQDRKSE